MRISDWSSDVCSSDLADGFVVASTTPSVAGTSRRGLFLHRRLREEPSSALIIGPAAPAEHISGVRIPVGRALRDGEGRFTGFLAATFQPERLRGFYAALGIGPAGIIRLIDRAGALPFSQPHSRPSCHTGVGPPPIPG